MRLIDADWLLSYMDLDDMDAFEATKTMEKIDIKLAIDDAPTIDAVKVVRCKDCKDFRPWGGQSKLGDCMVCVCDGENPFTMEETGFCSDGDRKDDRE